MGMRKTKSCLARETCLRSDGKRCTGHPSVHLKFIQFFFPTKSTVCKLYIDMHVPTHLLMGGSHLTGWKQSALENRRQPPLRATGQDDASGVGRAACCLLLCLG